MVIYCRPIERCLTLTLRTSTHIQLSHCPKPHTSSASQCFKCRCDDNPQTDCRRIWKLRCYMCSVQCTYRWLSVNQVVSYTRTVYLTLTLYEFHVRQFLITTNFLGSRPSVTEKVMRRTSYAGEMTPELKGMNKGIYESTEMPIQMINQSSAARPSAQVRHFRAKALQEDNSSDPRESCEGGD